MKSRFLSLNEVFSGAFCFWLLPHLALGAALLAALAFRGLPRINGGLLDMLPPDTGSAFPAGPALKALGERQSRSVVFLAADAEFDKARETGAALYRDLAATDYFEALSFFVDPGALQELEDFFFEYRYMLLDRDTRTLLEGGEGEAVALDALARVYGAFNFASLEHLNLDPFMLTEREMQRALDLSMRGAGPFSLKEDVLASRGDGRWFVMLRGMLTPQAASFSGKGNAAPSIYHAVEEGKKSGAEIYFSGPVFHSFESSSRAKREIALISSVSLAAIIALFLFYFRSLKPALVSALAAGLSTASAFGATLLFFSEPHLITLVFGSALIGICIDYSIHFFVYLRRVEGERLDAAPDAACAGLEVRRRIRRGVTMSFVSTEICFLALLFAPFGILRQFAVFSLFGMASSYLTVMFLFPALPASLTLSASYRGKRPLAEAAPPERRFPPLAGYVLAAALAGASLVIILANREKIAVHNDIRSLYTMPPFLRENEAAVSRALGYESAPLYCVVAGDSEEALLENEEALRGLLEGEIARGNMQSLLAASLSVPSLAEQKRSYAASAALLGLAREQFAALEFPPAAEEDFREDFAARKKAYLLPGGEMPAALEALFSQCHLGEKDGLYYSVCLLLGPGPDRAAFTEIADALPFVHLVDQAGSIGKDLDTLTRIMLILYLAAFVVIAVLAKACYLWGEALKVWAFLLMLGAVTAAVLTLCNIPVSFFPVSAFLLVFGLGLDYLFYFLEDPKSGKDSAALPAVVFSFLTTAFSFGGLGLSGFVPVHRFGVTALAGVSGAFVFALLLRGKHA